MTWMPSSPNGSVSDLVRLIVDLVRSCEWRRLGNWVWDYVVLGVLLPLLVTEWAAIGAVIFGMWLRER